MRLLPTHLRVPAVADNILVAGAWECPEGLLIGRDAPSISESLHLEVWSLGLSWDVRFGSKVAIWGAFGPTN